MAEYINRYEAIRAFCENCIEFKTCQRDDDLCDDLLPIIRFPAADVRENVRGEWIFEKGDGMTCVDGWYCSNCKHGFHTNVPYFSDYNFCPNCGADMRGENNG